jgi:hypothetical protein
VLLNPAHGKPGHKCEIAVGAPLDGTPAKAKQNTTVSQTPAATPKPAIAAGPAPKVNPAHGQPHHRCDIAVGAPLNATTAVAPPSPIVTPVTKTDTAPAIQQLQYTPGKP